jgi:hypothetical protein
MSSSYVCRHRWARPFSQFIKERKKGKLPFAQRANRKLIKEDRLGFRFLFDVSVSPCLPRLHVSMSRSPCLHASMSQCLHVSMSPCLHVSMPPCLHASMPPCLHASMSPCLHVSCLHLHVSISMFPEFHKRKTELTENSNFHLFAANRNGKRKIVFLSQ